MSNHNYGYDVNRILSLASEKGDFQTEGYALQLDDMLSNLKAMSPEIERFLDTTIDFLYGIVESQ